MTPTLPHFVWSLPPQGGRFSSWGGPAMNMTPTLPHYVWSLPPEGAAFHLGAARQ